VAIKLKILGGSAVGTFSKADRGLSLNFGRSGTDHCDEQCPMHPAQTGYSRYTCYARRLENRRDRSNLLNKLKRNYMSDPADLCQEAISDIERRTKSPPNWFRFSSFGSVPNPYTCKGNRKFRKWLRALISILDARGIPVHFPIETARKAAYYKLVLRNLNVVVRESATSLRRFLSAKGAVAFVGGTKENTLEERIDAARDVAKKRTKRSGRKCIVCPAVVVSFKRKLAQRRGQNYDFGHKAKCGICTACAKSDCDIVYPFH